MHFPLEYYCLGTTGQLPISKNILSYNVVVKYISIYIVNYRIGYYLDVKLADLIVILILRGERNKRIYRLVETLYVVVYLGRSIYIFLHSPGALSRSPTMKSEGLVPMEIPLGLIPRLMTKGESAWRKVKIEGSREKFPSGVFRRCNLGNEKGARYFN